MSEASSDMPDAIVSARERAPADGHATLSAAAEERSRRDEPVPTRPVSDASRRPQPFWTVERVLYALLVLVALFWRGWGLGESPLSAWEASNSWPAWLVAHGFSAAGASTPNSALHYGMQWLLFWLGTDGEWAARVVAVGAGIGLVVSAWWWREWLGRPAALVLAALLALDPWAVALGRMADGASLSLLLGFVVLTALVKAVANPFDDGKTWLKLGAVAAGLLIVSGPLGLNLLPVLALGVWLWRDELAEVGVPVRHLWGLAAASALLGGSLLLIRLDGLAWVASSLTVWIGQLDGRVTAAGLPRVIGAFDWGWLAARTVVEGLLPLVLGLIGLVSTWRVARRGSTVAAKWTRLMGGWVAWGVLLNLLPGRSPFSLAVLILPLALLAAPVVVRVWSMRPRDVARQELGAVLLTLLILLVSAAFWGAALGVNTTFDVVVAQATGVILALAVAIVLVFGIWSHRQSAGWVAAVLLIGLMSIFHVRASWLLSHASIGKPSGWQVTVAHPEVDQLRQDVETLSALTQGDPYQMPVHIETASTTGFDGQVIPAQRDPIVGWALRHMRSVTWGELPVTEASTGLVITIPRPEDGDVPPLPSHYAGSDYDIEYHWEPDALGRDVVVGDAARLQAWWQARLQPWWRWVIYRQPITTPPTRALILWAPRSGMQSQ